MPEPAVTDRRDRPPVARPSPGRRPPVGRAGWLIPGLITAASAVIVLLVAVQ